MWGALSDERAGLSFAIPIGSRQRSHFRARVHHILLSPIRDLPFVASFDSQARGEGIRPASTRKSTLCRIQSYI
jgi:hypothetical protein